MSNLPAQVTNRPLKFLISICLIIFSAGLLVLCFPKNEVPHLVWVSLIPIFFCLDRGRLRFAFGASYLCGFFFFLATLYWFIHVTLPGMVLLVAFLSLYFGFFGLGYQYFRRKYPRLSFLLIPALWAYLEYIRGHLFSGFGWVFLGHSQYQNIPLIQIADVTGVYGISFLIVWVNLMVKETAEALWRERKISRFIKSRALTVCVVMLAVLAYGLVKIKLPRYGTKIKVAVVQGNIEQNLKWDKRAWPLIMRTYRDITVDAAKTRPDLIVWPESSFPGILPDDEDEFAKLRRFIARIDIPLLLGVLEQDPRDVYHNSAFLISPDGEILEKYFKRHLVPFGEYIPLRGVFPFLEDIIPIGDFTPGQKVTVFDYSPAENLPSKHFSTLICFEDTLPYLARQFVNQGAQLLINLTNDAWFKDTKAPFLHLQASVFRTVENRRALIRATNTGVSAFINSVGRIEHIFKRDGQVTYASGFTIHEAAFSNDRTIYSRFGDIFIWLCVCLVSLGCLIPGLRKRN